jgi:hypothetical protein
MTKGEVLRYAIDFVLRRSQKIVRGLKERLTEDERYAVADHAVAQLKERDPWRLNEEAPGGEATIDMIDLLNWTEGIPPDTPAPPSVLKPRSSRPGLILLGSHSRFNEAVTQSGQAGCRGDADCSICRGSIQRE